MTRIGSLVPALVLALGIALLGRESSQHAVPLAAAVHSLSDTIGGVAGVDREISDESRRVAGMRDYLYREFLGDSALAFSVYVGYYDSQRQGRTIHSPKNCLPGGGWQALEASTDTLNADGESAIVNRYMLANGVERALVYYWYQGRGRVVANEYRVKWNLVRDAALHGRTEEALVRIVVPIRTGAPAAGEPSALEAATATARDVAMRLIPEMWGVLPSPPSS